MVLDHRLVAAGDEDEMLDAGLAAPRRPHAGSAAGRRPAAFPWAWPWWPAGSGCRGRRPGRRLCGWVSCVRHSSDNRCEPHKDRRLLNRLCDQQVSPSQFNGPATIFRPHRGLPAGRRAASYDAAAGAYSDNFGESDMASVVRHPEALRRGADRERHGRTGARPGLRHPALFPGPSTTGTVAPAQAPASPSAPEWSGEPGASGHPAMTAEAIRAAAANFRGCLDGLWPQAARRSVPRAVFDAHIAGLTPDLRIMDLLDSQPEFTKSFWDYLDILVSEARIANGRAILAKHRRDFDAVEKAYGVDRHFVAAIWGVESNYGTADRRPFGDPLDRDARLRRPPPGLFPRRVPVGAGNPRPWRRHGRSSQGLVGRRLRPDAIHADVVQAVCGRLRPGWPPQCR